MAIDPDTFRDVLSRWATGITVVTCHGARGVHGMTASAFCPVSMEPPLILVCVDRRRYTHALIEEQGAFGISLLSTEMQEVSDRCAGFTGEEGHWLNDLGWRVEVTVAPILNESLSWLDCSLWRSHDGGDHTIYVGEIRTGGCSEGEPLLWYRRGYRRLAE